jgi:hypothetical protein
MTPTTMNPIICKIAPVTRCFRGFFRLDPTAKAAQVKPQKIPEQNTSITDTWAR